MKTYTDQEFFTYLQINEISKFKEILKTGKSINTTSKEGSALHLAIRRDNLELVKFLLANNIDLSLEDKFGYTALHVTVSRNYPNTPEIFELLLKHNVNINQPTALHGETPLYIAIKYNNLDTAKLLIEHGAEVNAIIANDPDVSINEISKAELDKNITCLHLAALQGNLKAIRFLILNGGDISIVTSRGKTARDLFVYYRPSLTEEFDKTVQEASEEYKKRNAMKNTLTEPSRVLSIEEATSLISSPKSPSTEEEKTESSDTSPEKHVTFKTPETPLSWDWRHRIREKREEHKLSPYKKEAVPAYEHDMNKARNQYKIIKEALTSNQQKLLYDLLKENFQQKSSEKSESIINFV